MKRAGAMLLAVIILSGSFLRDRRVPTTTPDLVFPAFQSTLPLADYPSSDTPYWIESDDFWLVHTPEGQMFSFAPVSPDYGDFVSVDECRFAWEATNKRFTDPCSGDKWELNGRLNLEHSTELWSNRDLDQYVVTVEGGVITVDLDRKIPGTLRVESSPH